MLRSPAAHALYLAAAAVILRVLVSFGVMKGYLSRKFDTADAALGFAIGFASVELVVGGISNITSYTLCLTCNRDGLASILAAASNPEEAAALESLLREWRRWTAGSRCSPA